jgi:hypothetical protein
VSCLEHLKASRGHCSFLSALLTYLHPSLIEIFATLASMAM